MPQRRRANGSGQVIGSPLPDCRFLEWLTSPWDLFLEGYTWNDQRRTRTLSNGSVIWDFGGNVWQWVDYNNASDKPNPQVNWVEYPSITGSTTTPKSYSVPLKSRRPLSTKSKYQII